MKVKTGLRGHPCETNGTGMSLRSSTRPAGWVEPSITVGAVTAGNGVPTSVPTLITGTPPPGTSKMMFRPPSWFEVSIAARSVHVIFGSLRVASHTPCCRLVWRCAVGGRVHDDPVRVLEARGRLLLGRKRITHAPGVCDPSHWTSRNLPPPGGCGVTV